jgi:hypothetical protein
MFRIAAPLVLLLSTAALADDLRTLAGKTITGTVTAVNDKEIALKTETGTVSTPLTQVLAVDLRMPKAIPADKYTDVRLLDDTVLHCTKIAFKGKEATLTLSSGTAIQLPMHFLVSMVQDAQDPEVLKKWDKLRAVSVKRDRIVILKDGELNALEGTFGDADAEGKTIQFRLESGNMLMIPMERLHGMIFYRLEAPVETPLCRVLDVQGNSLTAVKLAYDGKTYTLTTSFGAKLPFAAEALARFDFNMGKLTYLSDLEPAKVVEKSGVGLIVHYKKDVNLDGEPILLDGKAHPKGLSLHAHTELEYNLAGKYKVFKALLGVDPRVGGDSEAQVTVLCDGERRFSEAVSSKAVRPLSINVKDVTTLKIIVSARNFLDLHDHVTLADALVSQ